MQLGWFEALNVGLQIPPETENAPKGFTGFLGRKGYEDPPPWIIIET